MTTGNQLPFEGLKVADFSWVWVGPTSTKYLADHGATVVRVETKLRPDIVRAIGPYKDKEVGPNRTHAFNDTNTSKLGVTLDLKTAEGLDIAKRIIKWADVYVESFTSGTMNELGIGYETAKELNPSIIMVSTCLMGQTGPASAFAGYGFHAGSVAGFYEITGWPDLPPAGPFTAYTDAIAPRMLASTIMAAVDHRRRTGQGQFIDAAQIEMALHSLAPQIMDYNINGRVVTRNGNRSDNAAPHGAYRCSGEDQWCAIAVESEDQWRSFKKVLGDHDWVHDSRFDTVEGRLEHQDELDEFIGPWTSGYTAHQVMRMLQREGVPAGVVQSAEQIYHDHHLRSRNFIVEMDHSPFFGRMEHPGITVNLSRTPGRLVRGVPDLGEHNSYVYTDLLGNSADDVARMIRDKVID